MRIDQEIAEQPKVLARLIARHDEFRGMLADVPAVVTVARGSSDHAATYLAHLIESRLGIPVSRAIPSMFSDGDGPLPTDALVIGISQSGRSPDLVRVLESARARHHPTLVITNDPTSPLARTADRIVDLGARPEIAVASTKSMTASLAACALLVAARTNELGLDDLAARAALAVTAPIDLRVVAMFAAGRTGLVIGRGPHLTTAREGALKLMELTRTPMFAVGSADLLHGPIVAFAEAPILRCVPWRADRTEELLDERLRDAEVAWIGDDGSIGMTPRGTGSADPLAPVLAIIGLQRLAVAAARARGFDVDAPVGLTKVTETT